ncbi:DUF3471 domain-containing protein [Pyxidicoccus sp. 3LFB2]
MDAAGRVPGRARHGLGRAFKADDAEREAKAQAKVAAASAGRNAQSKPSLPVDAYVGKYRDAWYGDVAIAKEGEKLVLRFSRTPALTGTLEHWQYDTFVAKWKDRALNADAYVSFSLKPDGSIGEMRMQPVSPLTDFSYDFQDLLFTPVKEDASGTVARPVP